MSELDIILSEIRDFKSEYIKNNENQWNALHENSMKLAALISAMPTTCAFKHNEIKESIVRELEEKEDRRDKKFREWLKIGAGSGGIYALIQIIKHWFIK